MNPASGNEPTLDWEEFSGRGDPRQRFRVYRLCGCEACEGTGKNPDSSLTLTQGVDIAAAEKSRPRCLVCRGEGRVRELVATCGSSEALGVALVTLGREGEFEECPVGVLDTEGEVGQKWIFRPWLPSPRNVSDAGRVLGSARKRGE